MKRFLTFVCACSTTLLLLSPANAAAQRGGGHGGGGGGHPSAPPSGGRGGGAGPGPSGGHGGYPSGTYRPPYSRGYYRPYYGGYYRPYYYSPYWYNGFYASFYYGLGSYPYYWSLAYGYPWGYYGSYGYPCCGYPYSGYAYGAWASVRLEMKPREAQVFVDGYYVGVVNDFDGVFQRLDVPAGQHELAVYLPGYQTWRTQALFRPGEGYHYSGNMQPLPPGTPEDPRPQPSPNAQPNNGYGQPGYGQPGEPGEPGQPGQPGQPGYPPPPNGNPNGGMYPYPPNGEPGRAQPMPGQPPVNTPAAGFGTLNLRVQPADAVVQIDGERWDNPDGGSRLIVQLAAGPHRIEVRKDGYKPYSTTIQIRPGEPQTINVVLPQQN